MLAFYEQTLGLRYLFAFPRPDGSPFLHYLQIAPKQYLEIMPTAEEPDGNSVHHLTFLVSDIYQAAAAMLGKEIKIFNGPTTLGCEVHAPEEIRCGGDGNPAFYLEDPELNQIELMQFVSGNKQSQYE